MRLILAFVLALLALAPACEVDSPQSSPLDRLADNECGTRVRCLIDECTELYKAYEATNPTPPLCDSSIPGDCSPEALAYFDCADACAPSPCGDDNPCGTFENCDSMCVNDVHDMDETVFDVFDRCRDDDSFDRADCEEAAAACDSVADPAPAA